MKRILLLLSVLLTVNMSFAKSDVYQYVTMDSGNEKLWIVANSLDENAKKINSSYSDQDNTFTISPNPGIDKLNIKLPLASSDMNVEVFDVLGKRVYKGVITQLESSINVANWKSGVYLVKVSNGKSIQTKRFIKQ